MTQIKTHGTFGQKGFTLLEILIIVAIFVALAGIGLSAFYNFNRHHALEKDTRAVFSVLEDARSRTLSAKNDSSWGVHFESTKVVLFEGTDYDASDPKNFLILLSSHVEISSIDLTDGAQSITFQRLTGDADVTGIITLSFINDPSVQKTISIYKTGLVERD
jgi:prepilin-type N-terminal cleavage/methylation domain-containing protein